MSELYRPIISLQSLVCPGLNTVTVLKFFK